MDLVRYFGSGVRNKVHTPQDTILNQVRNSISVHVGSLIEKFLFNFLAVIKSMLQLGKDRRYENTSLLLHYPSFAVAV